jgi:hypothetical protein
MAGQADGRADRILEKKSALMKSSRPIEDDVNSVCFLKQDFYSNSTFGVTVGV